MSREWKPGDVATHQGDYYLRTGNGWLYASSAGSWSHAERESADRVTSLVRPLVVIDPESKAETLALAEAYCVANPIAAAMPAVIADRLQSALREFANPTLPKHEEPTDLAARVVDKGGREWAQRKIDGRWRCMSQSHKTLTWSEVIESFGPVEVMR